MAIDPHAYKLELSHQADGGDVASDRAGATARPSLKVLFACCGIYTCIYRNAAGTAYRGRCPRCGLPVSFRVGEGGTEGRFFVVH